MAEDQLQVPLLQCHAAIVWRRQVCEAVVCRLLHHPRADRGVEPRCKSACKLQDAGARVLLQVQRERGGQGALFWPSFLCLRPDRRPLTAAFRPAALDRFNVGCAVPPSQVPICSSRSTVWQAWLCKSRSD